MTFKENKSEMQQIWRCNASEKWCSTSIIC